MPFAYFDRLSRAEQKVYLASDAVKSIALPDAAPLILITSSLRAALGEDDRDAVAAASNDLASSLCAALEVPGVAVAILAVRPRSTTSELHGLYTRPLDGSGAPTIEVWMRTAHHRRVVAFKTFLRTLVHEVCHHLDYEWLDLADSFHTQGFFERESSLVKQLVVTTSATRSA